MTHTAAAKIARRFSTVPAVKSTLIVYLTTDRTSTTGLRRSNNALATLRSAGIDVLRVRAAA